VTKSIIRGALSALALAALAATPTFAASAAPAPGPLSIPPDQAVTFQVPASPNGFTRDWTFSYPGDNSNITVNAEVTGLDPSFQTAVGFKVFDVSHQSAPVETATLQSNQKQNDPQGIEFNYSSGTPGTVTVQLFSYAPSALTVSVSHGGLVSPNGGNGSVITPVTFVGPGGAAGPAAPPASGAPASSAPSASTVSGGASLASGATASLNVPASPNGYSKAWTFSYPGDNSTITFDAGVTNLDPSFATSVGFNVFDSQHQTSPVETATLQSNQRQNDPHGIQFVYSSGTVGTVTVQFFSYAPTPVMLTLSQGGLVSPSGVNGSTTTPVTLQAA